MHSFDYDVQWSDLLLCLFLDDVQVKHGVDAVKRPENRRESHQIDFVAVRLK